MWRKTLKISAIIVAAILILTACGSSTPEPSEAGQEATTATVKEENVEEATTEAKVHPYAWMGLEDMPECSYLDILSSMHYIQTYKAYTMSIESEGTEAVDGINTYTENSGTRVYSVDGKITSINDNAKIYMEYDSSGPAETAKENLNKAMETGMNVYGRHFLGTGSSKIPEYSEKEDDSEYEYYEYDYPEAEKVSKAKILERFYMKDGDVFAVYKKTSTGKTELEQTHVIQSMSGDIPEGTFDLPDLSDYTKQE